MPDDVASLDVGYSGCVAEADPRVCRARVDREVVASIPHAMGATVVFTPEQAEELPSADPRYRRVSFPVDEGLRRVVVEQSSPQGRARWELALRVEESDALAEARSRLSTDPQAARAQAIDVLDRGPPEVVARAHALLARIEQRAGAMDKAITHYEAAIAGHMAAGRIQDAVWDAVSLSYLHREGLQELSRSREALDNVQSVVDTQLTYALDVQAVVGQSRGQLELALGRVSDAVRRLEAAREAAVRVSSSSRIYRSILSDLGEALRRAGRTQDAVRLQAEALDDAELEPCARGRLLSNMGWTLLSHGDAPLDVPLMLGPSPAAYFQAARETLETQCPSLRQDSNHVAVNLVVAELAQGRHEVAAAVRAQIDRGMLQPTADRTFRLTGGELRWARGETEQALGIVNGVLRDAEAAFDVENAAKARSLVPRLLAELGRPGEAIAAHEARLSAAYGVASLMPAELGREAFLARQRADAQHHVTLLLREGRAAEGLQVIRTLRAQAIQSLWASRRLDALTASQQREWEQYRSAFLSLRRERDALAADIWAMPAAQRERAEHGVRELEARARKALGLAFAGDQQASWTLKEPATGEALVSWFELEDGWWIFIRTRDGTVASPLGALDPEALDAAWLGPLVPLVDALDRVTLLPTGQLSRTDLQLLPVKGEPLIMHVDVAWALDVEPLDQRTPERSVALVVGDPRGDLPGAREEALFAGQVLNASGAQVVSLMGQDASRDAVLGAFGQADIFHYAGHGEAGAHPWSASLLLSEGSELTVPDVLAAQHVPRIVILAGCETAASDAGTFQSLGLAQAFVAAGAHASVAVSRPVPDEVARAFSAALHAHGGAHEGAAHGFTRAWRSLYGTLGPEALGAFRLIVR